MPLLCIFETWVWVSLGMDMFAAFPSTIMEAAFGRLHNRAGPFGARLTVVESIMVDGKAANIAIPDDTHTDFLNMQSKGIYWVLVWIVSLSDAAVNQIPNGKR